jgi:hypothetical protein
LKKEPPDWGFHFPADYVEQTFTIWLLSDYRVMPRPGGLDDQDPQWVADMALCMRLKAVQDQTYSDRLQTHLVRRDGRQHH